MKERGEERGEERERERERNRGLAFWFSSLPFSSLVRKTRWDQRGPVRVPT
jgi:hypothetical protein